MDEQQVKSCTAFVGSHCVASGELRTVARQVKEVMGNEQHTPILIFDDSTSELVEIDLRGTVEDVLARMASPATEETPAAGAPDADTNLQRGPGRPRLGVVAREVTLLPRHWDWLNSQPGGASVALRKLVEEARRVNENRDTIRRSQEAAFKFMSAMAGDLPGFEEATRALFAGDAERFNELIALWPADIRDHALKLACKAFSGR